MSSPDLVTEIKVVKYNSAISCRYFPKEVKAHKLHDIVLMCHDCHRRSESIDDDFRQRLAEMCDAPLLPDDLERFTEPVKVKGAAR